MAMTAWSAKVDTISICRGVNGSGCSRYIEIVPMATPSRRSGTASTVRPRIGVCAAGPRYIGSSNTSGMCVVLTAEESTPHGALPGRTERIGL